MRSDRDIRSDVEDELAWDPGVDNADIAVNVSGGVVTLAGFVKAYNDKTQAEAAAKRVAGVVGLANDIEVRLPNFDKRPDPDIAREAVAALKSQLPTAWEGIKVVVRDGWVSLEGSVQWQFQRTVAENVIRPLKGVTDLYNGMLVQSLPKAIDVKHNIERALLRNAEVDAGHINVESHNSAVVLRGTVRSWFERDEAQRAAWSAPGVTQVDNQIVINP